MGRATLPTVAVTPAAADEGSAGVAHLFSRNAQDYQPLVGQAAALAVLLASYFAKATDGHGDYFQADKAWLYVVVLSVSYMVSRGLAKSGTRHRHDDDA